MSKLPFLIFFFFPFSLFPFFSIFLFLLLFPPPLLIYSPSSLLSLSAPTTLTGSCRLSPPTPPPAPHPAPAPPSPRRASASNRHASPRRPSTSVRRASARPTSASHRRGQHHKGEVEPDGATFSWLHLLSGSPLRLQAPASPPEPPCSRPFDRAPRGAGAHFGALPNRALLGKTGALLRDLLVKFDKKILK
jgi:hypothetical protein